MGLANRLFAHSYLIYPLAAFKPETLHRPGIINIVAARFARENIPAKKKRVVPNFCLHAVSAVQDCALFMATSGMVGSIP